MPNMRVSTGSLRKVRKYDGTWEWQACVNVIEDGRRRQLRKMTGIACSPQTEAEKGSGRRVQATGKGARAATAFLAEWRQELVAQYATQEDSEQSQMSVLEYMDRYWSSLTIEPVTVDGYRKLRKHLDHEKLRMPIGEVTPTTVQAWIAAKREDGVGDNTIKKAFDQLRYACRWGVRMGELANDPTAPVKPPKKASRDPNPLDVDNIATLHELLDNLREAGGTHAIVADAAELALNTGMRMGELCGLRWEDIDATHIHVNRVVTTPSGGAKLKDYPKNKERRDVPLNASIRAILDQRREEQREFEGNDLAGCYVLARPHDAESFMSPGYLSHQWSTFIASTKVRGVQGILPHFHDLRHTFATQALINHVDVVTVASILGHRNTSTTLKYYARWMPNANQQAMDKMDGITGSKKSDDEDEEA